MVTSSVEKSVCEQGILLLESLFMHQFDHGTVFRVYCKDSFNHIAFKSLLRPHLKYQYNHFLESFQWSLQVFLTFLITVVHSVKVPLVTGWII